MDQSMTRVRVEDIEAALAQVGEIKAARVVTEPDGSIAEVHILALPSKSPKQLVRDIESTIMARFGIPIDHRKISIALLGRDNLIDEVDVPQRTTDLRPRIVSINAAVSGRQSTASVTLEVGDTEFVGMASGPASATSRARQVATATLDAVDQALGLDVVFALEDVAVVTLGRERVAVACVSVVGMSGEQAFTGSAVLRQNEWDSIVRATLDAINRRIGLLTTE